MDWAPAVNVLLRRVEAELTQRLPERCEFLQLADEVIAEPTQRSQLSIRIEIASTKTATSRRRSAESSPGARSLKLACGRMTSRPQLLFLCQTVPYPPDAGVWIRTYHIIRLLARAFDITALCFERTRPPEIGANGASEAALDVLARFANVEVFPVAQRHSRLRYLWDHLRSVALGRVYTEFVYESRAFGRRLPQRLSSTNFDLVHADSLGDLVAYLPACDGVLVVCVHHNVEVEILRRRASIEATGARRVYPSSRRILWRALRGSGARALPRMSWFQVPIAQR